MTVSLAWSTGYQVMTGVCMTADGDNKFNFGDAGCGDPAEHPSGDIWMVARPVRISLGEKSRQKINLGITSKRTENKAIGMGQNPQKECTK